MKDLGKIQELDEADLYDSGPEDAPTADSDYDESSPAQARTSPHTQMDVSGGSAKSTTLAVDLDASRGLQQAAGTRRDAAADSSYMPVPAPPRAQRGFTPSMAQSMPVKMGSSVPINIPFLPARGQGGSAMPADIPQPATFVPPHELSLMSQRDGYLSLLGDSPSTALRRDRLRVRNAILKSTGFLEPSGLSASGLSAAPSAPAIPVPSSGSALRAGGLSQALQLAGSPAAAAIF